MTISSSLITWLKDFTYGSKSMTAIDTDIQSANATSYSLAKEPIRNVKNYLSGKKEFTEHYTLVARLPSTTEKVRADNVSWGEALEAWVEEQNKNCNYPELDSDITVKEISVTTPFVIGVTTTNNSLYQMTVAIKYEKES